MAAPTPAARRKSLWPDGRARTGRSHRPDHLRHHGHHVRGVVVRLLHQGDRAAEDHQRGQARALASSGARPTFAKARTSCSKNGAYRQVVDDGLLAEEQHNKLTDPVDQHEWVAASLQRSQAAITAKLSTGLSLLATVGSTAPFVGLFGTVVGIYRALIRIGSSGQASIDAVAGPVGEALIMTALGLAVAVPAVMQYNWLMRRNKVIGENLLRFATDVHGYMASGGAVKPAVAAAPGATRPRARPLRRAPRRPARSARRGAATTTGSKA